jgi:hypothetical protein
MKKKKKILFKLANVTTLLALLLSTTIGCSEDEKDDDNKTPAQEVAGNYTGNANVDITGGEPLQNLTATANVTQGTADDKVNLTIQADNVPPPYGNENGSIQLQGPDLQLAKITEGNYALAGQIPFELAGNPIPLPLTGTFNTKNGTLQFTLELQGLVTIDFNGNK